MREVVIQIGAPTKGNIPVMFRKRPESSLTAD